MVDRSVQASGEIADRAGTADPVGTPATGVQGSRSRARAVRLLWLLSCAAVLALVVMAIRAEPTTDAGVNLFYLEFVAVVILFSSVGGFVALRRQDHYAGWVMLAFGVTLGLIVVLAEYADSGLPPATRTLPGAELAAWVAAVFFVPVIAGFATLFLLYFPNGRLLSPRWRPGLAVLAAACVAFIVGTAFAPGDFSGYRGVANPFGAPEAWAEPLAAVANIGNVGCLVAFLVAIASVVLRYRSASRLERYQIRWIALLGVVVGVCFSIAIFQISPISDIAWAAGFLVFALVPVAIGIAITRYHLYDIDGIINRAIVYGALTAILAGLFTASITLSQRAFSAVTGERSDAAIVITTLVVVSAYTPVRKWLEAVVDRRFKFESPRFGAYRAQLRDTLDLIDPEHARDRLVREVVRELGATGGALVVERDGERVPSHVVGEWSVDTVALSLPIPGDPLGERLQLTGRPDGRRYADREIASLEDVLGLVSRAMGLVEGRPGSSATARA